MTRSGGLRGAGRRLRCRAMTAADIIEMIKKLPPEERREVRAYFDQKEKAPAVEPPRTIRYAAAEKFNEIAPGFFEKHHELFRRLAEAERSEAPTTR